MVATRGWRCVLVVALACGSAGCGVELALIGAAASAASTGSAVYRRGKLNASWMADFDLVVAAAEAACSDLALVITASSGDARKGQWIVRSEKNDGKDIVIRIERKSPSLTEFQIDVGWFGSETTARLVYKRMNIAINLGSDLEGGSLP